jgi:hypothetical protein
MLISKIELNFIKKCKKKLWQKRLKQAFSQCMKIKYFLANFRKDYVFQVRLPIFKRRNLFGNHHYKHEVNKNLPHI